MKLFEQVVNLELSKKLKELGVKQESLFYWLYLEEPYISFNMNMEIGLGYPKIDEYICSAFTVSELLELLPDRINNYTFEIMHETAMVKDSDAFLNYHGNPLNIFNEYYVRFEPWLRVRYRTMKLESLIDYKDKKLPNACAKMLIYLIENNLINI